MPLQRTPTFQVIMNASTMRKRSPTQLTSKGVLDLPRRSASRRQLETLTAAIEINGGSPESRAPALDGMFATFCKYGKIADISRYVCSSQKVKKATVAKIKMHCAEYEKSEENFIRSLSLLYAGGVISKIKYQQTRSSLVMKNTGRHTKKGFLSKRRLTYGWGIPVPKPLPYSVLMNKIEELDMGEVISLRETLCHNLPVDQQVDGVYRNLESFLLMLCKFYFVTDEYRKDSDKLTWFGEREGTFKVAIGGDGAPFGKWDQSMSWLISFLNVGPRVASPNDNFLLFGANCKEDHEVVVRFTEKLAADIEVIEKKTYTVMGKDVTFTFDLIPGDMKFLAFINGELSNSAKYFSSFANVSQNESNSLTGRFGVDQDCKWRPWQYRERITTSKQVVEFKRKLPTHLAKKTLRSKVTQFIAGKKSRQEFQPFIGKLCDKEVVEPLHLKNNGVQYLHTMLLDVAISISNLPNKLNSLSELPQNTAIFRYMKAMESDIKAGRMRKQLGKWLLEDRGKDKDFTYRLTGKDSRLILHGFTYLVKAIQGDSTDPELLLKLLKIVFIGTKLRDCAAIFSMYHLTEQDLAKLSQLCQDYFTAAALFGSSVSGTVWSIGHLVYAHSKLMFDKYGTGLGINTMQGREAKHVQIASFARNSQYKQRWYQVFRHDHISKLWLPVKQPSLLAYHQSHDTLIPTRISKDPQHYCYCGLDKEADSELCLFCGHELMQEIKKSVCDGKPTQERLRYSK